MDVEVVKSDLVQLATDSRSEQDGIMHQGIGGISPAAANLPKDAVDERPEPKQVHSFYFVKYPRYEDPKLKAELELAESDFQKKIQARSQVFEKRRAKVKDKVKLDVQAMDLRIENGELWLRQTICKSRYPNGVNGEKGVRLCSSEEELDCVIKSLDERARHESISLSEKDQLYDETVLLEGTRETVIANDAMRAKLMGVYRVRNDPHAVKAWLKQLVDKSDVIGKELPKLNLEMRAAREKCDKAKVNLQELKKQQEEGNSCYYQNLTFLNEVRELAAKKDIEALKESENMEVEKFMSLWNSRKAFRDDYERRILLALHKRQLSWDGRRRNPIWRSHCCRKGHQIPKIIRWVTKNNVKRQTKEEDSISSRIDVPLVVKPPREAKNKPRKDTASLRWVFEHSWLKIVYSMKDKGEFYVSEKLQKHLEPKGNEVADEAKRKGSSRISLLFSYVKLWAFNRVKWLKRTYM